MNKLYVFWNVLTNMGWKYVLFRTKYEIKLKLGLLKRIFPTDVPLIKPINIENWKKQPIHFLFDSKESLQIPRNPTSALENYYKDFIKGKYVYFHSLIFDFGENDHWLTNPENGFHYDITKHWSEIPDFDEKAGDIKYVWEKSRFNFVFPIIRYDYHFQANCSELLLNKIENWIDTNPTNQGPNFKCSQEISIRIMAWMFTLYYYKNSDALTEQRFTKIINSIYWQLNHVYKNIEFSRIAVRNNHAISETLILYLGGLLFPFFDDASKWKDKGKVWFEEEILFQTFKDGSYSMFSMNYHRVVLQLTCWAMYLSEANQEKFSDAFYTRIQNSLQHLYDMQDETSGFLPNYGNNDGSLLFKLNDCDYRDFRPQLNTLFFFFEKQHLYDSHDVWEDAFWYTNNTTNTFKYLKKQTKSRYTIGGFYTIADNNSFTFIRCGNHLSRPGQADNLHLDIWCNGKNILHDAGTYKYNTEASDMLFFNGTTSHNTVMLGNENQMLKGPRFIWLNWTQSEHATLFEEEDFYIFEGSIKVFAHISKEIRHSRTIKKHKKRLFWEVIDTVSHHTDLPIHQIWNPSDDFFTTFAIEAIDENRQVIEPQIKKGWYSSLYGVKEQTKQIVFSTNHQTIKTTIKEKSI